MVNLDDARPGMRVRSNRKYGPSIHVGSLATVDDPPVVTNSSGSYLRVIWDGDGYNGGYWDHMFDWVDFVPAPEPVVDDNEVQELWY